MKDRIKQLAKNYLNEIINIRRHLHQYPELSFQETETAKFIISVLKDWGVEFESGIAGNGIVAIIKGKNPSKKVIALRADIDALPVTELNEVEYKSKNKGVMHACGHDVHTASLLGVIKILQQIKNDIDGTIKFIFQPAEEKLPGGAKQMIEEGVLSSVPIPELIIGQHVYPELPVGKIGIKKGSYMASSDEIYLTIKGKGGHAAIPKKVTNTVLIASTIIVELQKTIPENAPKGIPTILSFGKVIANGATNVIPNEVYIEGTFRTMNEEWRTKAHETIHVIANNIAHKMQGKAVVEIKKGYPVLVNNEKITESTIKFASEYLGKDNVDDLDIRMTSEDFAYYSQEIPSTFYRLGTSSDIDKEIVSLHAPNFNVDEKSLKIGMGTMAYIAYKFLSDK